MEKHILDVMNCKSEKSLRQFMSILYLYLNDIDRAMELLGKSEEDYIMKIFLLSTIVKASLR